MMNGPEIAIVAAIGADPRSFGIMGKDNDLIWRIPDDMARFKELTIGRPVIMGRKTFESIGRVLGGRDTIIVSRSMQQSPPGGYVRSTVPESLSLAHELAAARGAPEIMVIGGAGIFGAMFAYISGTPFVYIELFGVAPDTYGLLFALNAGDQVSAQVNGSVLTISFARKVAITPETIAAAIPGYINNGQIGRAHV